MNRAFDPLINHLDNLRNICGLDLSIIKHATDHYEALKRQRKVPDDIDEFEIETPYLPAYFPSCWSTVSPVIDLLIKTDSVRGPMVVFLDLLSSLVILVQGDVHEKAKLIFTWYNFSRSGKLAELEHYTFIMALARTFNSLRLIGALDMTRDDSRYSALVAKSYIDTGNRIKFRAGLPLDVFRNWLSESEEGIAVARFFSVMSKFYEVVHSLKERANLIWTILETKRMASELSVDIPSRQFLGTVPCSSPVLTVYRGDRLISIAVPLPRAHPVLDIAVMNGSVVPVLHLTCEKLVHVPDLSGHDCNKHYSVPRYHQFLIDDGIQSCGMTRIDLLGLDVDSRYRISVYTSSHHFSSVEAATLRMYGDNEDYAMPSPSSLLTSICILPATLSADAAADFLSSSDESRACDTIVFCGSIVPIDAILHQFGTSLLASEADKVDMCENLQKAVEAFYASMWATEAARVFGLSNCGFNTSVAQMSSPCSTACIDKQVLAFCGMGPWGRYDTRNRVRSVVGEKKFAALSCNLEQSYWRHYSATVKPPAMAPLIRSLNLRVFFLEVESPKWSDSRMETLIGQIQGMQSLTVADVLKYLSSEHSDSTSGALHLVFVMQSPDALMKHGEDVVSEKLAREDKELDRSIVIPIDSSDTNNNEPTAFDVDEVKSFATANIATAAASIPSDPALRGKYEIMYGEYGKSLTVASEGAKSVPLEVLMPTQKLWQALITSIFQWLGQSSSVSDRKVTFISTGWEKGVNFSIKSPLFDAMIRHENLLPTRLNDLSFDLSDQLSFCTKKSVDAGDDDDVEVTMRNVCQSLQQHATVALLDLSAVERAVIVSSSHSSESLIKFIPIPREFSSLPSQFDVPRLGIVHGPRIVSLTSSSVSLSLKTVGEGDITLTLYSLPQSLTKRQATGLLLLEREAMEKCKVNIVKKRCTKLGEVAVSFIDLSSHANFLVHVEPSFGATPVVAHFRTRATPSTPINSFILAGISDSDDEASSERVRLLCDIFECPRPRPLPVYLIHVQAGCTEPFATRSDGRRETYTLENLTSQAHIIQTAKDVVNGQYKDEHYIAEVPRTIRPLHSAQVAFHGVFCCISPRSTSLSSFHELIQCVRHTITCRRDVENLTVFLPRPLISFLQQRRSQPIGSAVGSSVSGAWGSAAPALWPHKALCVQLASLLFVWKADAPGYRGRDCQIMSVLDIDVPACATIWKSDEPPKDAPYYRDNCLPDIHASIRHILVPLRQRSAVGAAGGAGNDGQARVLLPTSICRLDDRSDIYYFVHKSCTLSHCGVHCIEPLWQAHSARSLNTKPVVYTVDIVPELNWLKSSLRQPSSQICNYLNTIILRPIVENVDSADFVYGPAVGHVSIDSAVLLAELNIDWAGLEFILRNVSKADETHTTIRTDFKAFSVAKISLSDLKEGSMYEVLAPHFSGAKILARFQTISRFPIYLEIAITGSSPLDNIAAVGDLSEHILFNETPDLVSLLTINEYVYSSERAYSECDEAVSGSAMRQPQLSDSANPWTWMCEYINRPCSTVRAIFHLGNPVFLSQESTGYFARVIQSLVRMGRRFGGSGSGSRDTVEALFFRQLEEIIRDTFRAVFNIPALRDALRGCSNLVLFSADFLRPDSGFVKKFGVSEVDIDTLKVIREVFRACLDSYVLPLNGALNSAPFITDTPNVLYSGSNPSPVLHSYVWRSGSLAVVMLDLESTRIVATTKSKKHKNKKAEEPKKPDGPPNPFSLGFLDGHQWAVLKKVAEDRKVSQVVILSAKPFLPLSKISSVPIVADIVEEGAIAWRPTAMDLDMFFQFWINWMKPKIDEVDDGGLQTPGAPVRVVTIICTDENHKYATSIFDPITALTLDQVCIGRFAADNKEDNSRFVLPDDVVVDGNFGAFSYKHRFGNALKSIELSQKPDFKRLSMNEGTKNVDEASRYTGLGDGGGLLLRTWFDSNAPKLSLKLVDSSRYSAKTCVTNDVQESFDNTAAAAVIVVGPILGHPFLFSFIDHTGQGLMVPFLLELDRDSDICITAEDVFASSTLTFEFAILAHKPTTCVLGPLPLETRFRFLATKGIQLGELYFEISTSISPDEDIYPILNCDVHEGASTISDFVKELQLRCSFPFHGISSVVYLNLQPSMQALLLIFRQCSQFLGTGLKLLRTRMKLSVHFKKYIYSIMDSIRDKFRDKLNQPGLRELMRATFCIIVATRPYVFPDESIPEDVELKEAWRFFLLLVSDVEKEYMMVPTRRSASVGHTHLNNEEIDLSTTACDSTKIVLNNKESVVSVVQRWLTESAGYAALQQNWISLNGLVSIELVHNVDKPIKPSPIHMGNRILITSGRLLGNEKESSSSEYERVSGLAYQLSSWCTENEQRADRYGTIVAPNWRQGTRTLTGEQSRERGGSEQRRMKNVLIVGVDSSFRSNKYDFAREMKKSLQRKRRLQKQAKTNIGDGKRAQQKRKEEQEAEIRMLEQEVTDAFNAASPDGYVILECLMEKIESVSKNLTDFEISSCAARFISTPKPMDGVKASPGVPSIFNYLRLPIWFLKLVPMDSGALVEDTVELAMKEDADVTKCLKWLETDDIILRITHLYEESALMQLSRPPQLREIDLSLPGLLPVIVHELVTKVWRDLIPDNLKAHMLTLTDAFVRSVLLYRTHPDDESLSTPAAFAAGMQQALLGSCAMSAAFRMYKKKVSGIREILVDNRSDEAFSAARASYSIERRIQEAVSRARVRHELETNPRPFDADEVRMTLFMTEGFDDEFGDNERDYELNELEAEIDRKRLELLNVREQEERTQRLQLLAEEQKKEELEYESQQIEETDAAGLFKQHMKKLEFKSFHKSVDAAILLLLDDSIEHIVKETIIENQISDRLLDAEQESTFEKRESEAKLWVESLRLARIGQREKLGEKVIYLTYSGNGG